MVCTDCVSGAFRAKMVAPIMQRTQPIHPKNVSFSLRMNVERMAQMTTLRAPRGVTRMASVKASERASERSGAIKAEPGKGDKDKKEMNEKNENSKSYVDNYQRRVISPQGLGRFSFTSPSLRTSRLTISCEITYLSHDHNDHPNPPHPILQIRMTHSSFVAFLRCSR